MANVVNLENLQQLAENFLSIADRYHIEVSNYLDGRNDNHSVVCYNRVKEAYRNFVRMYNAYFEERHDDALDYDLAESVL